MTPFDRLFGAAPRGRIVPPVPADRPSTKYATAKIAAALTAGFALTGASVSEQIKHHHKLRRDQDFDVDDDDADEQADQISRGLDLSPLHAIVPVVGYALGVTALDQISRSLGRLGQIDQLGKNTEQIAGDMARTRAAEMVGMRRDATTGELKPNPSAKWAIDETTRSMIRQTIATGLKDGRSVDDIASDIAAADSPTFSKARSLMIAKTEVANINQKSALASFKIARGNGMPLKKIWTTMSGNACDECQGNEDDGPIDLDDTFSSGDDSPPLHPSCGCMISAAIDGED
jgi:hypothetical protein